MIISMEVKEMIPSEVMMGLIRCPEKQATISLKEERGLI